MQILLQLCYRENRNTHLHSRLVVCDLERVDSCPVTETAGAVVWSSIVRSVVQPVVRSSNRFGSVLVTTTEEANHANDQANPRSNA